MLSYRQVMGVCVCVWRVHVFRTWSERQDSGWSACYWLERVQIRRLSLSVWRTEPRRSSPPEWWRWTSLCHQSPLQVAETSASGRIRRMFSLSLSVNLFIYLFLFLFLGLQVYFTNLLLNLPLSGPAVWRWHPTTNRKTNLFI